MKSLLELVSKVSASFASGKPMPDAEIVREVSKVMADIKLSRNGQQVDGTAAAADSEAITSAEKAPIPVASLTNEKVKAKNGTVKGTQKVESAVKAKVQRKPKAPAKTAAKAPTKSTPKAKK